MSHLQSLLTTSRKHVLEDLEPYICTFSSCSLDSFHSQHAWFQHELLMHRSQWICSQCSVSLGSSHDLERHIRRNHHAIFSERQLPIIVDLSKRPVDSIRPSECPFCDGLWAKADSSPTLSDSALVVDLHQFRRHVGYHMQQIALFALPRLSHDHDQDGSAEAHHASGHSDQDTKSVHSQRGNRNYGYGWSMVLRKRAIFLALTYFSNLYQSLSDDLDKLASLSDLARKHGYEGQWIEAEKLEKRILGVRISVLGKEHPDSLKSMNNMVIILIAQQNYKEAERLGRETEELTKRALGTSHPDTLESMDNLAIALGNLGNMK